jgi:hypothetical protein
MHAFQQSWPQTISLEDVEKAHKFAFEAGATYSGVFQMVSEDPRNRGCSFQDALFDPVTK